MANALPSQSRRATAPAPRREKWMCWLTLAGQTDAQGRQLTFRGLARDILEYGYERFVPAFVEPLLADGYGMAGLILHHPWGVSPDDGMEFDEYLVSGPRLMGRAFVRPWDPVVRLLAARGAPVVAYIGRMRGIARLDEMRESPRQAALYVERLARSIEPIVEAGMHVAIDAAMELGSTERLFIELLSDRGVAFKLEGLPMRGSWQARYPVVIEDAGWRRRHTVPGAVGDNELMWLGRLTTPDGAAGERWGERVPGWLAPRIAAIEADRHVPIIAPPMVDGRVTPAAEVEASVVAHLAGHAPGAAI